MRTEDLIATLSQDLKPTPSVGQKLLRPAIAGGLIALVLVAYWLGFRPDILRAWAAPMFWVKAAYTGLIALAGFGCTRILARPIGEPWKGFVAALAIFGVVALGGTIQLAMTSTFDRRALLMGGSWHVCSQNIVILGGPILAEPWPRPSSGRRVQPRVFSQVDWRRRFMGSTARNTLWPSSPSGTVWAWLC